MCIVWCKANGDSLRSLNYLYDMAGGITNLTTAGAGMARRDAAYGYDTLDRLTSVSVFTNLQPSASSLSTFSYDLADNRTNATHNGASTAYTLGIGDRLASTADGAAYLYTAAGCVTNISVPSVVSLSWNSQYQLTAVYTNGAPAESYQYDALGRRIATSAGGTTTYHIYDDNWQVLADLDASGNPLRSYTWGPGIDHLLAMTVYGTAATNTYYALTDHLGTVHAMAGTNGVISESYEFDAWGNVLAVYDASGTPISNRQSAIGNRYLFQGREYSFVTGLYHFRHRWYDPMTKRWLSNDPIGISGGLNQYVFCANSPVNSVDPFGLYSLYGDMADMASSGWSRGGVSGSVQGNVYSGIIALLDTIGGRAVGSTASRSGVAAGEGRTGAAIGWGTASAGLIAVNAVSFGKLGSIGASTKGGGVMEFSHWIPDRAGGPVSWWNGRVVTITEHALNDPWRHRWMPRAWKSVHPINPAWLRQLNRLPDWFRGVIGIGAATGLNNLYDDPYGGDDCK